jgi:hypothetical protein
MQLTEKSYVITLKNKKIISVDTRKRMKKAKNAHADDLFPLFLFFSRSHDRRELAFSCCTRRRKRCT